MTTPATPPQTHHVARPQGVLGGRTAVLPPLRGGSRRRPVSGRRRINGHAMEPRALIDLSEVTHHAPLRAHRASQKQV